MATMPTKPSEPSLEKFEAVLPMLENTLAGMKKTVDSMAHKKFTGHSQDRTVSITVTGTGLIEDPDEDIQFGTAAVSDGLKKFKRRVGEALKDAIEQVQGGMQDELSGIQKSMELPPDLMQLMQDISKKEEE